MKDREAFTEYFTVRRDSVRRTAYLLCGDWHLADDLAQITFVRLAGASDRQCGRFPPEGMDADHSLRAHQGHFLGSRGAHGNHQ